MRTKNEVSTALQDPTPCDGCTHRSDCRSEKLACLDFQAWVNNGTIWNGNGFMPPNQAAQNRYSPHGLRPPPF